MKFSAEIRKKDKKVLTRGPARGNIFLVLNSAEHARVVELADSLDSGSSVHYARAGSSPASRTIGNPLELQRLQGFLLSLGNMRFWMNGIDLMEKQENASSFSKLEAALSEIENTLDQMLALAQLSASDLNVDRDMLQKTLERLQGKIDRIADCL